MMFSNLARVLAVASFVIGLSNVVIGIAIATEIVGPYEAALRRYTSKSSSGQVIDGGIYKIILAVALGTLAEISFSMRKLSERT